MLQSLSIENYRGISQLDLEDFSRINIFVGQNGSGKTTVLEAVSLAAEPLLGQHIRLGIWRDMPYPTVDNSDLLRAIFFNLNQDIPVTLSFETNNQPETQTLKTCPLPANSALQAEHWDNHSFDKLDDWLGADAFSRQLRGLKQIYHPRQNGPVEQILRLRIDGYDVKQSPSDIDYLGCFFIHSRRVTSIQETARMVTSLFESKQVKDKFLNALNKIAPHVRDVQVGYRGGGPIIQINLGDKQLIPLNVLGDGFCRLFLILTAMMGSHAQVIVVDDIDSGLHHTIMPKFWQDMLTLTELFDKQLFCVTHNEEMLLSTLDGFADNPDPLRIYRIDRQPNGQATAQPYDYRLFANADRAGFEIR